MREVLEVLTFLVRRVRLYERAEQLCDLKILNLA